MRALLILTALALPGCGSSSSSAVDIQTFSFKPATAEVGVGDTVTWHNRDDTNHTVTADGAGGFESAPMSKGGMFEHTFGAAGRFAYFCSIHDSMRGEIVAR
jgi:plastocyanin